MEQKQKKSISHLADEEHLSGEACWSESGAKTQALFSLFLIKKHFYLFIWSYVYVRMKAHPLLGEVVGVVLQM